MKKLLLALLICCQLTLGTFTSVFADNQTIANLFKTGVNAFKGKNYAVAATHFNKALIMAKQENDPNLPTLYYNLSLSYFNAENYTEAEKYFVDSLNYKSHESIDEADVYKNLAHSQRYQEKYDQAESNYLKALTLYKQRGGKNASTVGDINVELYRIYDLQDKDQKAQQSLQTAISIIENNPDSGYFSQLEPLRQNLSNLRFYNDKQKTRAQGKKTAEEFDPNNPVDLFNRAKALYDNDDIEQAQELLLKSVQLSKPTDGHLVDVYNYLGFISFLNLQLDQAEYNFKKSFEVANTNYGDDLPIQQIYAGTSLVLGKTYLFKGNFDQAKYFTNQAIEGFERTNNSDNLKKAKKQLAEIKDANSEGSYTYKTGDVTRWNDTTTEILVYLTEGTSLEGWNPENTNLAKLAFDEWSDKINHRLNFKFTTDPDNYDVKFSWVQEPFESNDNSEHVPVGINKTGTWGNLLRYSDIEISLKNMDKRLFSKEALYSTILHEIGHMIGLKEHSNNPADIMYPFTKGGGISERDLQTFNELYSKEPTYTNPSGIKLSQISKNIILIDQGREYINEGKYKKAYRYLRRMSDAFDAGMIDELDYLMGIAAYGSEKYEEAIEFLKPAKANYSIKRYPQRYLGICYVQLGHKHHDKWGKKNKKKAKAYYAEGVSVLQQFMADERVDPLQKTGVERFLREGLAQRPPKPVYQYNNNGFNRYGNFNTHGFIQL